MNYIPIFAPVDGTVEYLDDTSITIRSKKNGQIYAPIFGNITINHDSSTISLSITNNYLSNPIKLIMDKNNKTMINIPPTGLVKYTENIGFFPQNHTVRLITMDKFVTMVDKATDTVGGKTEIMFSIIKEHIKIKTKPRRLIIITIPHTICDYTKPRTEHVCDFEAENFANILREVLEEDEINNVYFYRGNIIRTSTDLNRPKSLYTDYRKAIRNRVIMKIKEIKITYPSYPESNIIYIIDCHSFPSQSTSFQNIRYKNPDVTVIFTDCNQLIYMDELTEIFKEFNISASKVIGSNNSIIDEFYFIDAYYQLEKSNIKIVPVLIEINESNTQQKMKSIGLAIKGWMPKVNNYIIENVFKFNNHQTKY